MSHKHSKGTSKYKGDGPGKSSRFNHKETSGSIEVEGVGSAEISLSKMKGSLIKADNKKTLTLTLDPTALMVGLLEKSGLPINLNDIEMGEFNIPKIPGLTDAIAISPSASSSTQLVLEFRGVDELKLCYADLVANSSASISATSGGVGSLMGGVDGSFSYSRSIETPLKNIVDRSPFSNLLYDLQVSGPYTETLTHPTYLGKLIMIFMKSMNIYYPTYTMLFLHQVNLVTVY